MDGTGTVSDTRDEGLARLVRVDCQPEILRYVVEKGSIAVDGVSLTVARLDDAESTFSVALIPHTLAATIAEGYEKGSVVNLEADVVARYVARNLRR